MKTNKRRSLFSGASTLMLLFMGTWSDSVLAGTVEVTIRRDLPESKSLAVLSMNSIQTSSLPMRRYVQLTAMPFAGNSEASSSLRDGIPGKTDFPATLEFSADPERKTATIRIMVDNQSDSQWHDHYIFYSVSNDADIPQMLERARAAFSCLRLVNLGISSHAEVYASPNARMPNASGLLNCNDRDQ